VKILVVNWRCIKNPEAGGAEIHMHEIFRRVASMGHDVTLVAHAFKGAPKEEVIDGIKTVRIGNRYLFHYAFKRYYKKHLEGKFDIVVDDISKIPLFTPQYVKEPLVGISLHIHGKTLYKELPKLVADYIINRELRIPEVYKGKLIFADSPSARDELIRMGHPEDRTALLYAGIDHELFKNNTEPKTAYPLISYIGRLKRYKQVDLIVKAMPMILREFPDAVLEIGGKGDDLPNIEAAVKEAGVEKNVRFLGFLSEEDKAKAMARATVTATMAEKEGWGITVIESNAAGTPVVGSNVQGLRDSIVDGKTGILAEPGDSADLAQKIISLLKDRERLQRMEAEARAWAATFTWERSAEYFIERAKQEIAAGK
jgi:glycosyltransferase involved in cell wall biosynthesis